MTAPTDEAVAACVAAFTGTGSKPEHPLNAIHRMLGQAASHGAKVLIAEGSVARLYNPDEDGEGELGFAPATRISPCEVGL